MIRNALAAQYKESFLSFGTSEYREYDFVSEPLGESNYHG